MPLFALLSPLVNYLQLLPIFPLSLPLTRKSAYPMSKHLPISSVDHLLQLLIFLGLSFAFAESQVVPSSQDLMLYLCFLKGALQAVDISSTQSFFGQFSPMLQRDGLITHCYQHYQVGIPSPSDHSHHHWQPLSLLSFFSSLRCPSISYKSPSLILPCSLLSGPFVFHSLLFDLRIVQT